MMDNAAVLDPAPAAKNAPLFTMLHKYEECEAILLRNSVGRIAFALQDRVSVVPVHYVYDAGWIYGRTAAAGKLRGILRNRRVAFEVDEHTQLFEWQSVVVRGPLYLLEPGTSASDRRLYAKAVSLIRMLLPSALTDSDPVPFRDQLFRIRVAEVSGRTSEPIGGEKRFPNGEQPTLETGKPDADAILSHRVKVALSRVDLSSASRVNVDAFDSVIVLTGIADDAAERSAIEATVLGVPEVRAVVQQLETLFPSHQQPTPAEIAREALKELAQSPRVADPAIKVVVEHGWLRLEGKANSQPSREEAIRRLRTVNGSRGVIDRLRVGTQPTAQAVTDKSSKGRRS